MLDHDIVSCAVRAALEEDLGTGDITSRAVIEPGARARGSIVARQRCVVAGLGVAREVFRQVDPAVVFEELVPEGDLAQAGESVARVTGPARAILAGERTALNFLQRMCGIATTTRRLVSLASGSTATICDTRKTVPGLRALDKYAVRIGGGTNHRAGLFDAILIKDNHWRLAGGIAEAVRRARSAATGAAGETLPVEVEVGTIDELREALAARAEAVLLDNMDPSTLEQAVALGRGRALLEVSGGVDEGDIPRLAALGVDRISLGALTHSVRAADLALELGAA
ncbi:MAG TPA: carboxylating nicotinate-nucleotide diphosphorylase [Candidatus Polarisedimenticolia bacterium]|nr:carboxylating nicotinate-nucleotide diphosphorylase [Candidatus Polarisedimenticolia bacterium]